MDCGQRREERTIKREGGVLVGFHGGGGLDLGGRVGQDGRALTQPVQPLHVPPAVHLQAGQRLAHGGQRQQLVGRQLGHQQRQHQLRLMAVTAVRVPRCCVAQQRVLFIGRKIQATFRAFPDIERRHAPSLRNCLFLVFVTFR